jgi:hypothetical protein
VCCGQNRKGIVVWKDDSIGREFKAHLTAKAEKDIGVYVVFDVFGNLSVPRAFKQFPPNIPTLRFALWRHVWRQQHQKKGSNACECYNDRAELPPV